MKKEKELILKMLEEKKITSEEAMRLLEELEKNNKEKNFSNNNMNFGNKMNFGNMISKFVKNTVNAAMSAVANSKKNSINLGGQNVYSSYSHKYVLKDKIPNDIDNINIKLANGDIVLNGEAIDNPQLKVYTHNHAEKSEVEKRFEINSSDGYLTISELNKYGDDSIEDIKFNNINNHYKLELSLPLSKEYKFITVSTLNGDIDIDDFKSEEANLKTSNGDIDLDDITVNSLNVVTSNGDIDLDNITGYDISLITSRGDIQLDEFEVNSLDIQTSMGDIDLNDPIGIGETISCSTSMGDIDVDLVGVSADLEVEASINAPMGDLDFADRFILMDGNKRKRRVYTNTNFKRRVYIRLNTSFGDITVK